MDAILKFDPGQYSERTLRLILAKAEELKVTPAEAAAHLIDQVAAKEERLAERRNEGAA